MGGFLAVRRCLTRARLPAGLYPHKAGIGHMTADYGSPAYQGYLRNDAVTIAEVLRLAGNRSLMSGKWHVAGCASWLKKARYLLPDTAFCLINAVSRLTWTSRAM